MKKQANKNKLYCFRVLYNTGLATNWMMMAPNYHACDAHIPLALNKQTSKCVTPLGSERIWV